MRNIINISLPLEMVKIVRREVKRGKYATVSEFFRSLLRQYEEENRILAELRQSHREIKNGKGKILHTLKDLR